MSRYCPNVCLNHYHLFGCVDERDERQRVKKYSAFIKSLPKINRSTLDALLQHLYRYTHIHTHLEYIQLVLVKVNVEVNFIFTNGR